MLSSKIKLVLLLSFSVILWGCQASTSPKMQDEKASLQQQLKAMTAEVGSLSADRKLLQQDVAELNRIVGVLGEEKNSRVVESANVRGQVRQFVQTQIDSLKQFLLESHLLDYIGGELTQRSSLDKQPLLIVDLQHAIPENGSLTGVGAFFQGSGTISVKVLRPIENNYVVVWASPVLAVSEPGLQLLSFPVSVSVEKGDRLAYYLAQTEQVSFDTGTGDTRYVDGDLGIGAILNEVSMKGAKEKRSYSIGVYGLLTSL
ncbi:MAG: hypothetical protein ACI92E_000351 [Oceanicoccus sp.]|jgi:hypothetical protein